MAHTPETIRAIDALWEHAASHMPEPAWESLVLLMDPDGSVYEALRPDLADTEPEPEVDLAATTATILARVRARLSNAKSETLKQPPSA